MVRRNIAPIDWIMLGLAVISVSLICYETWGNPTPEQSRQIILADYVIIGIFAIEFGVRLTKAENRKSFMMRNWYDLLGMIPVAHPAVRGFRLFRLIRILVILSRFGRAADRAVGEEFTYRLLKKSKNVIVELVSDAVTLRVMDMTLDVLEKGAYTKNLADHIENTGEEVLDLIVEKVETDPTIGKVRHMPFFDDIVRTSSHITQRLLIDLLRDERMDAMIKSAIRQNVQQMKAEVARKDSLRQPLRSE